MEAGELAEFLDCIGKQVEALQGSSIQRCQVLRQKLIEYEAVLSSFMAGSYDTMELLV